MLNKQDYINCYRAMDGVNIVGIVRSFHIALLKMNDLDSKGKNEHPVTLLYVDKLCQLSDLHLPSINDRLMDAYKQVSEASK